jgi:hypothetical protein
MHAGRVEGALGDFFLLLLWCFLTGAEADLAGELVEGLHFCC